MLGCVYVKLCCVMLCNVALRCVAANANPNMNVSFQIRRSSSLSSCNTSWRWSLYSNCTVGAPQLRSPPFDSQFHETRKLRFVYVWFRLAAGEVQESYCYQIFLEQNNNLLLPTVQQLVEHSFHHAGLKLAEVSFPVHTSGVVGRKPTKAKNNIYF